jgi:phosphoribosylformimino-5-aminoimidazole carboxamide ribotide isomerase
MRLRPCIDLRNGKVVQIVGGSLDDNNTNAALINFETERSSEYYAGIYKRDGLKGGHVISLGSGNREAVFSALRAYPGGLQAGGGIDPENADEYINAGASHVIVTSYVFSGGEIDIERLTKLFGKVGRERLVLDLSCRKRGDDFVIVTDRWQKFTDVVINSNTLETLSEYCDEFLVHGVDVEGKRQGIEIDLVELLGQYSPIPVTYAGGIRSLEELDLIKEIGSGRVDATIGSALDIFGGDISYDEVVIWHNSNV